jgi:SAM-dependent methyltransferase
MKVFDAYSDYYDLLYQDKNYSKEVDYIDALIKQYSPATKTILELGSGTGLHACLLAKLGYTIHGIDRSDTMLKKAIERQNGLEESIAQRLSFNKGDICNYQSSKKYDAAISLFHVMSYMETNEMLMQAINTAKSHIKPNGLFIFDCWHGPAVLADRPISRTKIFENDTMYVKRVSNPEIHVEKNLVDVNFDILIENKKSDGKTTLQESHKMRYLFPEELTTLLNKAGFSLLHTEEWISKNPLSENTWNACYICKKQS